MASLRTHIFLSYLALVLLLIAAGWATVVVAPHLLVLSFLAAAIILGGWCVIAVARSILRPLDALTKSAHEIESGNLQPNFPAGGPTEIASLSHSFHAMADTLQNFRRHDEARLVRSQEATRAAINSLPHAVAILSPDGQIELSNDVATRLFSMKEGANAFELPHKWLRPLIDRAAKQRTRVEPEGFDGAVQVFEKTHELFFLPHAIPLLNAQNELVGTTLVLVDATELRQVDEAKSGLIASASHELKTPLTSIQMSIHLLLEDAASRLTPRQVELLRAARDDADRLHELIGNLLDAGRRQKPE